MVGEACCEEMLIYHVYVRDGVGGNVGTVEIRNVPFVSLFRSNDRAIGNRFFVLRAPMSSKGEAGDEVFAFLGIDEFDVPLNNISRRALMVLIIQKTCKCLVLTV